MLQWCVELFVFSCGFCKSCLRVWYKEGQVAIRTKNYEEIGGICKHYIAWNIFKIIFLSNSHNVLYYNAETVDRNVICKNILKDA